MPKSSDFPVFRKISEMEELIGSLSPVQKMLLGTDGSVTGLLQVVTGSHIEIETLMQKVVPAEESVAAELSVAAGELVNHRIVKLKRADTGETLVYAVSHTPLKRLEPSFKDDLIRADIPIGSILKKHRIESRREITAAGFCRADQEMSRIFRTLPRELMLSRSYKIIRQGEPLIAISETFPYNSLREDLRVIVETPARIHLTLMDLSGCSGRVDGGVGIALDEPNIMLEAERGSELVVKGENADRARAAAEAVTRAFRPGWSQNKHQRRLQDARGPGWRNTIGHSRRKGAL